MSTNEIAGETVAKQAPTEQQASKPGAPKRFEKGQTVCNEKDAKGKLHNGHLKQVSPIREDARQHMRGDDLLYRCQTCGALYMGPPLGHVRDPGKQARYVQSELVTILEAAGGTLPAFKQNATGAWVPVNEAKPHAPAPVAAAAAQNIKPAMTPKPTPAATTTAAAAPSGDETPEQKRARIIAEAKAAARMAGGTAAKSEASAAPTTPPPSPSPAASPLPAAPTTTAPAGETAEQKRARMMAEVKAKAAAKMAAKNNPNAGGQTSIAMPPLTAQPPSPTSGTDSSDAADAHRPAAEAQAATGQASAVPLSPAAATASPAAGVETVADLAPDASTELTPGAPKDGPATTDESTPA